MSGFSNSPEIVKDQLSNKNLFPILKRVSERSKMKARDCESNSMVEKAVRTKT